MLNKELLAVAGSNTVKVKVTNTCGQGGAIVFDAVSDSVAEGETKEIQFPVGVLITASYRDPVISGELFIMSSSDNIYYKDTRRFTILRSQPNSYMAFGDLY